MYKPGVEVTLAACACRLRELGRSTTMLIKLYFFIKCQGSRRALSLASPSAEACAWRGSQEPEFVRPGGGPPRLAGGRAKRLRL